MLTNSALKEGQSISPKKMQVCKFGNLVFVVKQSVDPACRSIIINQDHRNR